MGSFFRSTGVDPDSAEARFERVVRLLRGDGRVNEPFVAEEVEALAQAGRADAARLAATIAAVGYGRTQDWGAALDWLVRAAEADDASAQGQLRLLAHAEGGDWRALARAVDVAAWSAARPTRLVVERPRIGAGEAFLEPRVCAWLIERAGPLQEASLVYDPMSGKPAQSEARTNTVATFPLLDLDLPLVLIRERIAATMSVASAHLERTSVFRYVVGQTFASHFDFLSPSPQLNQEIARWGQRPVTFLVYLNDAFEGGETHFIALDKKLRGGVGDALFFHNVDEDGAPDPLTEHAGAPPTSGEKWLLSQFIRDRPQLPG
ncbi:MAG: 2OG-Fe(II) oxygenase [Vitreimonas sp.]